MVNLYIEDDIKNLIRRANSVKEYDTLLMHLTDIDISKQMKQISQVAY